MEINQSQLSSGTRGSAKRTVKYVNLQALIDREILIDSMIQNFTKGESITEISIELWYLICDTDIVDTNQAKPQQKSEQTTKAQIIEKIEELKDLDKQSQISMVSVLDNYQNPYEEFLSDRRFRRQIVISIKLQMIASRLCGFFDEVLVLEKMRQRSDVTPLFKNMLDYVYKSHLILCAVVIGQLPDSTKNQNVSDNFTALTNLVINRNGRTSSPKFQKSTQGGVLKCSKRDRTVRRSFSRTITILPK